jgi:carbon monoxide dehydrogenase subunit G
MEDIVPPHAYRLVVDGSGRPGFVKGTATITLTEDDGGTRVSIAARADIGGTIARVGQRLLEGVARSMTERFFACMSRRLTKQ